MFVVAVGLSFGLPVLGPQMVRPGMPFRVVGAFISEKPVITNRTGDRIREVEYPRAKIRLTLDDEARVRLVNGKGEEPSPEKELERIREALPAGFKRTGYPPLLKSGEKPGKGTEVYGYTRVRVARMTSDTTAKITISFYLTGKNDEEEEYGTAFVFLSWYRDWWTVSKYEGWVGTQTGKDRLTAYIDEVSDNKPKP